MTTKKKDVVIKENHIIEYKFTKDELEVKAKQLAIACQDKSAIEDQKKQITTSFKYKIEGKESEINLLSNHLASGYEMKTVTCECKKDFDKGVKEYWYEGVLYDTQKLNASDYQLSIEEQEHNAATQEA